MTCSAATFSGVTAFDRGVFDRRPAGRRMATTVDYRRAACRSVGLGVGTLTITGLMAGTAAVAATWIVAAALSGAPHLKSNMSLVASTAVADWSADLTHSADLAADLAADRAPSQIPVERNKGSRLRTPFGRTLASDVLRARRELAAALARPALPQVAAAPRPDS